MKPKILFFIADGLGDLPCKELGGKTPLEAAKTPNLDKLASNGYCGKLIPRGLGKTVPLVDASLMTFALLGYDVEKVKPKRGPLEVIGLGKKYKNGWLAARCNFAAVKNGIIKNMRVGGTKEMDKKINGMKMSVPFFFSRGPGHRAVVVFKGKFSDNLSAVDPHKVGKKVMKCGPLDKKSKKAAEVVNEFLEKSALILKNEKANFILPRGFSVSLPKIEKFERKFKSSAASLSDADVLGKGIFKVCGIGTKRNADMQFVYYKDTDPPAHRGDAVGKKKAIEKFDKLLGKYGLKNKIIVVTADHCTPCEKKGHSADPIPCLISFGSDGKGKRKFGERFCKDFKIPQNRLMKFVLNASPVFDV